MKAIPRLRRFLGTLLLAAVAFAQVAPVDARQLRSTAAVNAFKRANPCPATGAVRGKCRGWEVDHVVALCAGGPDSPANMQWLTVSDHRQKTKLDVMHCRRLKAGRYSRSIK